jgi:plasmid stabilization system protein ParE
VTLRLLPEAQQEIDEAFSHYEARRTGLGVRFIAALERGYDLVEAYPRAWPRARRNTRWYKLNRFPYAIVYMQRQHDIVVVAVSHVRRRRGYWVHRLRRQR